MIRSLTLAALLCVASPVAAQGGTVFYGDMMIQAWTVDAHVINGQPVLIAMGNDITVSIGVSGTRSLVGLSAIESHVLVTDPALIGQDWGYRDPNTWDFFSVMPLNSTGLNSASGGGLFRGSPSRPGSYRVLTYGTCGTPGGTCMQLGSSAVAVIVFAVDVL